MQQRSSKQADREKQRQKQRPNTRQPRFNSNSATKRLSPLSPTPLHSFPRVKPENVVFVQCWMVGVVWIGRHWLGLFAMRSLSFPWLGWLAAAGVRRVSQPVILPLVLSPLTNVRRAAHTEIARTEQSEAAQGVVEPSRRATHIHRPMQQLISLDRCSLALRLSSHSCMSLLSAHSRSVKCGMSAAGLRAAAAAASASLLQPSAAVAAAQQQQQHARRLMHSGAHVARARLGKACHAQVCARRMLHTSRNLQSDGKKR